MSTLLVISVAVAQLGQSWPTALVKIALPTPFTYVLVVEVLPLGITIVILWWMKTAVSIPDSIFRAADSLAKQLGMSRSELFAHAVEAYIEAHKHGGLIEALDAVYTEESSTLDQALAQMQWTSFPRDDW